MAFEVRVPRVGESINEVTIGRWLRNDGDTVAVDDPLCEVESDKTSFELPAERAGVLKRIANEGDTVKIGAVVASIEESGASASPSPAPAPAEPYVPAPRKANLGDAAATPAPQVFAPDIKKQPEPAPAPVAAAPVPEPPAPKVPEPAPKVAKGGTRRERMTTLRRTISKRLVAAKNETAMLTTFNEVDMSSVMAIRSKYGEMFQKKHGVKPGFVSFFVMFACEALKKWPTVNAMIDGDEIIYNDFCDVGIAVSTERGLVVPPIRNADQMTIVELEREIARLAEAGRSNKLGIDDLIGGTFTLTMGGVFGSMLSTPILNAPQSAILGMHKIVERPVVVNGEIVVRPIMYVALSYDHRIIDGREAVGFLVSVKELMEEPARILLSL